MYLLLSGGKLLFCLSKSILRCMYLFSGIGYLPFCSV
jgi:hypothetical protein